MNETESAFQVTEHQPTATIDRNTATLLDTELTENSDDVSDYSFVFEKLIENAVIGDLTYPTASQLGVIVDISKWHCNHHMS